MKVKRKQEHFYIQEKNLLKNVLPSNRKNVLFPLLCQGDFRNQQSSQVRNNRTGNVVFEINNSRAVGCIVVLGGSHLERLF